MGYQPASFLNSSSHIASCAAPAGLSPSQSGGSSVPIQNSTSNIQDSAPASSYGQILRSSSIVGGAQAVNYLIGLVRTKLVAVLLGPSGVGLVGLYQATTGLVATVSGLGIGQSGVREVAEAQGSGDASRVARTVKTLRRACWFTGVLGWLLTAALAYPLSQWTFGSGERAVAVAFLGCSLLFTAISGGQTALLQGIRRIGDLARINVLSTALGTVVAVALYAWLGERGIVPVLIATAVLQLACSWWFARRVAVAPVALSWAATAASARRLLGLGLAFSWAALLAALVGLAVRALIVRDLGLDANGIYQAAWGLSGAFAGFVLGAMGTDFYPRLTAAVGNHPEANRLVNEQTEVGVLLALPGLIGTLVFAPWVMQIFYSAKFVSGAELLPWFVLGIFGRVVSFPMGYVLLAKGASGWFALSETIASGLLLALSLVLLRTHGLVGTAYAFAILYGFHCLGMAWVSHHLTGFRWSRSALRILGLALLLVVAGLATQHWLPPALCLAVGAVLTAVSGLASLRGIAARLGCHHRLVRAVCRIPGGRLACGV